VSEMSAQPRHSVTADNIGVLVGQLLAEVARQDSLHSGYRPTRDGMRLALAALQDELDEALAAHRAGRCKCATIDCGHHDWTELRVELIQVAAVAIRAIRSIDTYERDPPP
jgi:hypothetical protein